MAPILDWGILLHPLVHFCKLWVTLRYQKPWTDQILTVIVLNMFIAVIQENFDVSEDEKRLQQVKAFLQKKEQGFDSSDG